jgi:hypothetical protein
MDVIARAIAYVEKCPPAISGSNGSTQTFTVANALVRKFALDREAALFVLEQHYNPLCQPPWTRRDLQHKVDSALRKGRGEIGAYVRDGHAFHHRLPANDIDEENALPIVKFDAFARWLADACPLERNKGAVEFLSNRRVLIQAQIAGLFALPESFDEQGRLVNDAFAQFGEQTMLRTGMVKVETGCRRFTLPRNTLCIPWRRPIDGSIQTLQRRFIGNGEPRAKYASPRGRAARWPFGAERLTPESRVVLCEGALDALAIQAIARDPNTIPLALPGVDGWLDEWLRFTVGRDVVIALDADNAGRTRANLIAEAIQATGQTRSLKTIYPPSAKDWGEHLVKHYGR